MKLISETSIEDLVIGLLEKQGYHYIYAPDIAHDSDTPERQSFEDVLLMERLQTAVGKINPAIPADIRQEAVKQILRLNSPELIANNERFLEPQEGDIIIEISGGTEKQSTGRTIYINSDIKSLFQLPLIFSNFCRLLKIKKENIPILSTRIYNIFIKKMSFLILKTAVLESRILIRRHCFLN